MLCDRYLSVKVNLRTTKNVKLVREEMLGKVGKVHTKLFDRCHVSSEIFVVLENHTSLLEANYESCLQENEVLHAQLVVKSL